MTSDRADAYRRVLTTLHDIGPAKLWPSEQTCIREASDPRLFSGGRGGDDARTAFAAVAELVNRLVETGRWTDSRARELLDDVWACGPGASGLEAIAA